MGLFKILSKVGDVAYKLELPPSSSIHSVFHVSLLKPAATPPPNVRASLPDNNSFQVPEWVLQTRLHLRDNRSMKQLLIKWLDLDKDLATWEDANAIV
jgi:hypothetical protein